MSKHTPGPWVAQAWNCHAKTTVRSADGVVVAECAGHGRDGRECEADAALIASLPQLLTAVQIALDALHGDSWAKRQYAIQRLQAALIAPAREEALR